MLGRNLGFVAGHREIGRQNDNLPALLEKFWRARSKAKDVVVVCEIGNLSHMTGHTMPECGR